MFFSFSFPCPPDPPKIKIGWFFKHDVIVASVAKQLSEGYFCSNKVLAMFVWKIHYRSRVLSANESGLNIAASLFFMLTQRITASGDESGLSRCWISSVKNTARIIHISKWNLLRIRDNPCRPTQKMVVQGGGPLARFTNLKNRGSRFTDIKILAALYRWYDFYDLDRRSG